MPDTAALASSADSHAPATPRFVPYTALGKLEEKLEHYLLVNSPFHFPKHQRERAVRVAPWCALSCIPLVLFSVVLDVGMAALSFLTGSPMGLVLVAVSLAATVFGLRALPGLFKRTRQGWRFFVYECLAVAALCLVDIDLVGIAGMTVSLWCAFQLKYEYA
jgi:hypothetical protein